MKANLLIATKQSAAHIRFINRSRTWLLVEMGIIFVIERNFDNEIFFSKRWCRPEQIMNEQKIKKMFIIDEIKKRHLKINVAHPSQIFYCIVCKPKERIYCWSWGSSFIFSWWSY